MLGTFHQGYREVLWEGVEGARTIAVVGDPEVTIAPHTVELVTAMGTKLPLFFRTLSSLSPSEGCKHPHLETPLCPAVSMLPIKRLTKGVQISSHRHVFSTLAEPSHLQQRTVVLDFDLLFQRLHPINRQA